MLNITRQVRTTEGVSLLIALFAVVICAVPTRIATIDELIQNAELSTYDTRMRLANAILDRLGRNTHVALDIQLVGMETRDQYRYGPEIDSREIHAELLGFLNEQGTRAVVFDILFSGPQAGDDLLALNMRQSNVFVPVVFSRQESEDALAGDFMTPEISDELAAFREQLTDAGDGVLDAMLYDLVDAHAELQQRLESLPSNDTLTVQQRLDAKRRLKLIELPLNEYEQWLAGREHLKRFFSIRDFDPERDAAIPSATFVEIPSTPILLAAKGVGFITTEVDIDGVLRRNPMLFEYDGRIYPNLDLAFICHEYGVALKDLHITLGDAITFTPERNSTLAEVRIPIDEKGRARLYFSEGESLINRAYSLGSLISWNRRPPESDTQAHKYFQQYMQQRVAAGFDPEWLNKSIVIVGENDVGGTDIKPIPLTQSYSLFATHAHMIDNIRRQRFWREPRWIVTTAINVLIGLVAWLLINNMPYRRLGVALALLLAAFNLLAIGLFTFAQLIIPMARSNLTLVLSSMLLLMYRVGVVERRDRTIRNYFDRMVSPEVVSQILESSDRSSLEGSKRLATIFFIDLRGFTTLLERHDAAGILDVLNNYYDLVSRAVIRNRGHVNKFIGDAVLGIFGAPQTIERPEWAALQTALQVRAAILALNGSQRLRELGIALTCGIGVNTGEVVVGMVGGAETKTDYTALGDGVNVASRLQNHARNNNILLGEDTWRRATSDVPPAWQDAPIEFRKLENVRIKGKSEELTVYELIAPDGFSGPSKYEPTDHS
ncbi:adenylate/guanylate cyclase domain-containing protein [Candidatus Sumerlaeota bacterium]|nr:adenylate/guanylate cyclase domain-containing protein [Candidatus Sumerlaeota bacterium]